MLDFDGSADGLELGSALATAAPLTFACFFISDSATASQCLISLSRTTRIDRFDLLVSGDVANDPIRAVTTTNNVAVIASTSPSGYSVGTLTHAAAVFASNISRTAYLNGVASTVNTGNSTPLSINRTNIGCRQNGSGGYSSFFDGRIGDVGIWNVALTQPEITALAKGCSPLLIRPQSLLAYCDVVQNGRNYKGTAFSNVGSPAVAVHSPRIYRSHGFYTNFASSQAYTLAADAGSYALTGSAAGLRATRLIAADAGVYSLTGSAAGLRAARRIAADPGSYVLTGFDTTLTQGGAADTGTSGYRIAFGSMHRMMTP